MAQAVKATGPAERAHEAAMALRQQLSDCSGKSLPHVFNVQHYFDSLFGHFPGGTIAGGGGHLRRGAGA